MAKTTEEKKIKIIADGSQVTSTMKQMSDATRILSQQLNNLTPGTDAFIKKTKELQDVKNRLGDLRNEVNQNQTAMQKLTAEAGSFAAGLGVAFVVSTVVNFFKVSSTEAKNFEKALSSLSSITGSTGEDLEFFGDQAKQIGLETGLASLEVVKGFELIGSARPDLLKNKEALAMVTREAATLAKAAGIDLPQAAQSLAGAMNQFQLPASESTRLINALAAGSKEGAATIQDQADSIDKFGVAAASFNVSFEESVGLVQTLAEFNIKGAESGTALRNVLAKMSAAEVLPPEALAQLAKFGVDLAIVSDTTLPMNVRLREFSKISGDAAALTKVFGLENKIAGEVILQNVDKFENYTTAVTGTNTAIEQAAINSNNTDGALAKMGETITQIKIGIGQFLNTALFPVIKGFTALLLGLIEIPKFIKENRELFVALGVSILALNGANISAAASALYHATVEKGRAIATRASAAAQWLMNAALTANPIGIVVVAIAGLVAGLMQLYRTNTAVRASINGLFESAKAAFGGIRDAAMNILGGVGDLLAGIFTFDTAKIKAGWESLTASAAEISTKTAEAYGKAYTETFAVTSKEIAEAHEVAAAEIVVIEDDKNTEITEAEKAAAALRLANLEKEKVERQKLLDDFAKKEIDAKKALEDLEVSLIADASERKLAELQLQHQRQMEALDTERADVLVNTAITEEQRIAMLENLRAQEDARDAEYKTNKKEVETEEKILNAEEALELDLALLDNRMLRGLETEAAYEEAKLQLQKDFIQKRLDALTQAGLGETTQALALKNQLLTIDKQIADGKIAEAEREENYKKQIKAVGLETAREFMQLGLDLLAEDSKARKVAALAMKAFEIGLVVTSGIREIQGYWASNAGIPIIGPGLATALSIAAGVRTLGAVNKIRTAKYATGGQTGSGNMIDMMMGGDGTWRMPNGQGTRNVGTFKNGGHIGSASFGVIGEAGSEWVGPNWMMRSPKYANIFGYLEAERKRATPFASGGSTGSAPQIPQASGGGGDPQQVMAMIEQFGNMQVLLMDIKTTLQQWPDRLRVYNDPRDIRSGVRVLNEIEADSRINR